MHPPFSSSRGAKIKSVQTFSLAATHHAILSLVNIGASTMEPTTAISFGTKGSRMSSGHLKVAGQLKLLGGENHKTINIYFPLWLMVDQSSSEKSKNPCRDHTSGKTSLYINAFWCCASSPELFHLAFRSESDASTASKKISFLGLAVSLTDSAI